MAREDEGAQQSGRRFDSLNQGEGSFYLLRHAFGAKNER
jgi:hypothetical protein